MCKYAKNKQFEIEYIPVYYLLICQNSEFEKPMNIKRYYLIDVMARESPQVVQSDSVTRVTVFCHESGYLVTRVAKIVIHEKPL